MENELQIRCNLAKLVKLDRRSRLGIYIDFQAALLAIELDVSLYAPDFPRDWFNERLVLKLNWFTERLTGEGLNTDDFLRD